MQDAWLAFAREGRPAAPGLPEWRPYRSGERETMVFGAESGLARDPFGAERAVWDGLI